MSLVFEARDLLAMVGYLSLDNTTGRVVSLIDPNGNHLRNNARVSPDFVEYSTRFLRNTIVETTLIQVVLLPIVLCWFPEFIKRRELILYLNKDFDRYGKEEAPTYKVVYCGERKGVEASFYQLVSVNKQRENYSNLWDAKEIDDGANYSISSFSEVTCDF